MITNAKKYHRYRFPREIISHGVRFTASSGT